MERMQRKKEDKMRARGRNVGVLLLALAVLLGVTALAQDVVPKGIIINPVVPPGLSVNVWLDKAVYALGEQIQIHYEVNQDAYIYVYDITADGNVVLLFPNFWSQSNYVGAGQHVLPDSAAYRYTVSEPTGTEYLEVIASTQPLSVVPQFQSSSPFALLGGDPEAFQQQFQAQVLGIVPQQAWTQDWTSFEVVAASQPSQATLVIQSAPSGASISLDGAPVGNTPRTVYVSAGLHQIILSKAGYQSWSRTLFILGTGTRTIQATLVPLGPVNQAPNAAFTMAPSPSPLGALVQFNASTSSDSDGVIVTYQWSFGDGWTGTGPIVQHQYAAVGSYPVTLTVYDDDGASDTATQTLVVSAANQSPTAIFSVSPPTPVVGTFVSFDGSASSDPDGVIVSYQWSFGDGWTGAGPVGQHQYGSPGVYPVTLTVVDDDGAADSVTTNLTVGTSNRAPVAVFVTSPPQPTPGNPVLFDASDSFDPDGSIVSYQWNFGDGWTGAGPTVQHVYALPGSYPVTLMVFDNAGLSGTSSRTIAVSSGYVPPPDGEPPMGGTPGIFVWGSDRWHITVNSGAFWSMPRDYRLELRTVGSFENVNQTTTGGVVPLGIDIVPTGSQKTLLFEGSIFSGSIDYTFTVSDAESIWMSLKLDIDGDGDLDELTSFVHLRYTMVHPPNAPFVVGLPAGSTSALLPGINFRIGLPIRYDVDGPFNWVWIAWRGDIEDYEP